MYIAEENTTLSQYATLTGVSSVGVGGGGWEMVCVCVCATEVKNFGGGKESVDCVKPVVSCGCLLYGCSSLGVV